MGRDAPRVEAALPLLYNRWCVMAALLILDALSVSLLTERRERVPILSEVSLSLQRGEMVALVGESGSGKSTLGLSLMRLLPREAQWSGRMLLQLPDGVVDLATLPERAVRRHRGRSVAMVFQEPGSALDPRLRVGEQVAGSLRIHRRISRRAAWEAAVAMLDRVGLAESERRARDYPHQLSGGMRQRVALAMALIQQPALLVADEPTTALDLRLQEQNLQLLRQEAERSGLAVLLITHDLRLAAQWCDRIAVLYAGRLLEVGSRHEIIASSRHPYTRALLALSPTMDQAAGLVPVLPGSAAAAADFVDACAFAPRCPRRQTICTASLPEWQEQKGRGVRCFFSEAQRAVAGDGQ